jgi:hypothetical protein
MALLIRVVGLVVVDMQTPQRDLAEMAARASLLLSGPNNGN